MIYEGPQSEVDRLAAAYGLVVVKRLSGGAVLAGRNLAIEALARDGSVGLAGRGRAGVRPERGPGPVDGRQPPVEGGGPERELLGPDWPRALAIAVIDSGFASHPDVDNRILTQVDFTGEGTGDLYGHGTHVASIIAGSGAGNRTADGSSTVGMAPGAELVSLKVLSADGTGYVSDVIRAIDWTIANKDRFGIRVINLSLGTPAFGSYADDPMAKAVERAVAAGIVVVASAGNFGKLPDGTPIVGGIVSPGYTPGALTVGALNTKGTVQRSDDVVASYSSRGPVGNPEDQSSWELKPDVVAPGNAIVAAGAVGSYLWENYPQRRV